MLAIASLSGKSVAVFGLGASGRSAARALRAGGARAFAGDDGAPQPGSVDLKAMDWGQFALLVLAPGVPLTHPRPHWSVERARAAGIPVVGDIELFMRERERLGGTSPFVAVTGTNGKSTTTALIAHILGVAGRRVAMGGNIGVPILDLEGPSADRVHVVECSSYQIDLTPSLKPTVGMLLNVTPDHLDRHGTLENYAAVKERLVAASEVALIGVDDAPCRAIAARLKARATPSDPRAVVAISAQPSPLADLWVEGHRIVSIEGGAKRVWVDLASAAALRGAHNGQNAAFAFAATRALGVAPATIAAGIASFPGLAHRMEPLGRIGKVLFVNDSKATNADAAEKALLSFRDIHWIAGGRAKAGGIEPLRPLFGRVAKAYLIGEAGDEFARTLEGASPFERCGTLEVATLAAARDAATSAAAEPVVLLAPACASFDQFANFELRGEEFRALVAGLAAAAAAPTRNDRSIP